MSLADMIPTMDDPSLANLRANAMRLSAGDAGPRQASALEILPVVEAEIAARKAAKPKATPKPRKLSAKALAAQAAAAAEAEAAEDDDEEEPGGVTEIGAEPEPEPEEARAD